MTKLVLIFTSLCLVSCNYSIDKKAKDTGDIAANGDEKIGAEALSFTEIKTAVLKEQCIGCHSKYANYTVVIAEVSKIRDSVVSGRMPKDGSLSTEEKAKLIAWIDAGAPEEGRAPAPSAPPVSPTPTTQPTPAETIEPTYASINATIFKTHACLKCHANSEEGEFVYDMNSLAAIRIDDARAVATKNPALSLMIEAVTATGRGRMPPGTRAPLTQKEIEVLKRWFELGLPE